MTSTAASSVATTQSTPSTFSSTSTVTSTTQSVNSGIMTSNINTFPPHLQQFPELDLKNPHNSFQTFDMFVKLYKMSDPDTIYCSFIKKLPIRMLELVRDKIDESLHATEKLSQAKDIIISHVNNSGRNSLDLLLCAEKRPDVTYTEFLRTLKNLGAAANAGHNIIKNRFLEKVSDKTQYAIAMTLIRNESLETVAEILDSATKSSTDSADIYAIHNSNPNYKKLDNNREVTKQTSRLEDAENQLGTLTTAVATMSIKIEKILQNMERSAQDFKHTNHYGNNRSQHQYYAQNNYDRNAQNFNNPQPYNNYNRNSKTALINRDNSTPPRGQGQYTSQQNIDRTCFYHTKFGSQAYNCDPPCRFEKRSLPKNGRSTV